MDKIKQKIDKLFLKEYVEVVENSCIITEDAKEGLTECDIFLAKGILLKNLDDWKIKIFKHKRVADYCILQPLANGKWKLNVIEIKKSVSTKRWNKKIKLQFRGAYLYALTLIEILDIDIEDVKFITVYNKDNITNAINMTELKAGINNIDDSENDDWLNDYYFLENIEGIKVKYEHKKHPLEIVKIGDKEIVKGELRLE